MYYLARDIGEPDVEQLRRKLTTRAFQRWQAFYTVEAKLKRKASRQ